VVASLQAIRRPPIADSKDYTHKQYDMSKSNILVRKHGALTEVYAGTSYTDVADCQI